MRVRVRRVGAGSLFLLCLVLCALVGLLTGGIVVAASRLALPTEAGSTLLDRIGLWSLLLFPVAYGLVGGIAGAVAGAIYNLAASVTGGVALRLDGLERETRSRGEGEAETAPETTVAGGSESETTGRE